MARKRNRATETDRAEEFADDAFADWDAEPAVGSEDYDSECDTLDEEDESPFGTTRFGRMAEHDDSDEDMAVSMEDATSTDDMDELLGKSGEESNLDPHTFGLSESKARNIYCDNSELVEEIRKYQEENVATQKLGELLIKIGVHMTSMARFWRYSISIKEELAQSAIAQMSKSVPKFDLKKKNPNAFGYMSMIAYREMLHTLKKHFKPSKIRDDVAEVYVSRLSEKNSSDERIGMLRQTLQKSEEYNRFLKSEKYPYDGKRKREVDTFALSKSEQSRRHKESLRRQSDEKHATRRRRRTK